MANLGLKLDADHCRASEIDPVKRKLLEAVRKDTLLRVSSRSNIPTVFQQLFQSQSPLHYRLISSRQEWCF